MSQQLESIKKLIEDKYDFLPKENRSLMLLHAEHELESNNNFMDIAQPVTGVFDDIVNSGKCFVCTTAIITIINPILVSSLPSHLIKKGLLGIVDSLSKACGLSKSKVTEKIMEYDSFTLVDNGAGWFAKKLCSC